MSTLKEVTEKLSAKQDALHALFAEAKTDDGDQLDQLLDERAFSRKVNRSVSSLRKDRMFGRGFPYIKLGKLVRYSPRDARKEIDRCRRTSTTDTGAVA